MRTTLALLTLLLAFLPLHSQEWRLCHPARHYYFGEPGWEVQECLRIDSVQTVGSDTVLFPSKRLDFDHFLGPDSCTPLTLTYSRFGQRIVVQPSGRYEFILSPTQSYVLETRPTGPWTVLTNPGTSWPSSIVADSFYFDTGTVLGVPDSILHIRLVYEFPVGVVDSVAWIQISKQHGALKYPIGLGTGQLMGVTQPQLGVANLVKEDFFPMQPGDTIQIYDEYYNGFVESWYYQDIQDIYLQRQTSIGGDTLFFQIDRAIRYGYDYGPQTTTTARQTVWDTIPIGSPAYQRLDRDFGEIWGPDLNQSDWLLSWFLGGHFPDRVKKAMNLHDRIPPGDSCLEYSYTFILDCEKDYFWDGLGGPYWECGTFGTFGDFHHYRYPTFAHVGNDIIGHYVDFDSLFTGVPVPQVFEGLSIHPNPAQSEVTIAFPSRPVPSDAQISLIDLQGQVVQRQAASPGKPTTLDVATLPRGIYLVQVQMSTGVLTRQLVLW